MLGKKYLQFFKSKLLRIGVLLLASLPFILSLNNYAYAAYGQKAIINQTKFSTVWGTYGIFSLFTSNPSELPLPLKRALGITGRISIANQGPVYETIKHYLAEAGINSWYADAMYKKLRSEGSSRDIFSVNDGSTTFDSHYGNSQRQSFRQYEKDSLQPEGGWYNSPMLIGRDKPFSISTTDAPYTSFSVRGQKGGGELFQYPTLSSISRYNKHFRSLTDFHTNKNLSINPWLNRVISANPSHRGLVGYRYSFLYQPNDYIPGCGESLPGQTSIDPLQFVPYVRFAVITANQQRTALPIHIKLTTKNSDLSSYSIIQKNSNNKESSTHSSKESKVTLYSKERGRISFLIPVEFGFKYIDYPLIRDVEASDMKPIWKSPVYMSDGNIPHKTKQISLDSEFVDNMKHRKLDIPISHQLIIGPSISNLEVTTISGIRDQHVAVLNMAHIMLFGSCPYLILYDRENKYWVEYGPILIGRKSKELETKENYLIGRDIGKLLIQERENETSYINSISVTYVDSDGVHGEIKAKDLNLYATDTNYHILRKGESLEVDLSSLPRGSRDITVHIGGYYLVDSAGTSQTNPQPSDR